ncbi:MAG: gamma-glutamyl-gamma-aminobutyrate hydrolase family protein, partial [Limnochordales bacterium]
ETVQVLNVAAGGTLYQDIPSQVPGALKHAQKAPRWAASHAVRLEADSRLAEILGATELRVNSYHHQSVKDVAPGFRAVATAPDGIIEAVESAAHRFAMGVQWHPELMVEREPRYAALFRAFIEAARAVKAVTA